MREVEFLHYHPGASLWHRHDPRLKLLELSVWSILALSAPPEVSGIIFLILIILLGISGTRISRMKKPLLFWFFMAGAIILTAGLTDQGKRMVIGSRILPFSCNGIIYGISRSGRLLTVLMAGQLLSSTTDPSEISGAVRKILYFLPDSWTAGLSTAISLTLAFIPGILDETAQIRDAAYSRGLGSRRSPFHRSVSLALPMAEAALRRADLTADALLSRCYDENPTPMEMHIRASDIWLSLSVILPPLLLSPLFSI
jgi:energy-coupling factor transporter transmembrane protein EcfT